MKILIRTVLCLIILSSNVLYPQWIKQDIPERCSGIFSIDFCSKDRGVISGNYFDSSGMLGKAFYTTNSGNEWKEATIPDSISLVVNVSFVNDSLLYATGVVVYNYPDYDRKYLDEINPAFNKFSGYYDIKNLMNTNSYGYLLKSTDNGSNWFITGSPDYNIGNIYFLNEQLGYSANPSGILRTTDAGYSWNYIHSISEDTRIYNIKFFDDMHGFAAGSIWPAIKEKAVYLRTLDGGNTWENFEIENLRLIENFVFLDKNTILIIGLEQNELGYNGVVYKSTDLGNSWQSFKNYGSANYITGIDITPDRKSIAITGINQNKFGIPFPSIDISHDGGLNWVYNIITNFQHDWPSGVKLIDSINCYIIGYSFTHADGFVLAHLNGLLQDKKTLLDYYKLYQNYPNPFNSETRIKFNIPPSPALIVDNIEVTLKVYDLLGQEVSTILNKVLSWGDYEISFDGSGLSSGVYIYKLKFGNSIDTKKMILLR